MGEGRQGAVTLKQVAEQAGVSVATASHVFTGKKRVTPAVNERVHQAAHDLGYRLNTAARALRTGHSQTLGLLVPDLTNPFFPQLARSVGARARIDGYATVLFESGYEAQAEARGLAFLETHRIDGLIWVLGRGGHLPKKPPPFPTVIVDYAPSQWFAVRADDEMGGRIQARHALDLGHRTGLALWGDLSVTSIRERRRGFLAEAAGALDLTDEIECPFALTLPDDVKRRVLSKRGQYSFVVCGNDVLAVAVLRALREVGLRVPQDISVVGFDDTPLCELVDPPLTSVAQSAADLGTFAVEGVLRQLQDVPPPPHQVVLPVTLVPRGSTAARSAGEA